jgi:hypothetical protein
MYYYMAYYCISQIRIDYCTLSIPLAPFTRRRLTVLRRNFTAVAILVFMAIAAILIVYVASSTRGL